MKNYLLLISFSLMAKVGAKILVKGAEILTGFFIEKALEQFDDEDWYKTGDAIDTEINLANQRSINGDKFPQGLDNVIATMKYCKDNHKCMHMKAQKTFPKWTWYVEVP